MKKIAFLLALAPALMACGGGDLMSAVKSAVSLEPTKVWLQRVYFQVDEKLNNDAPVTVDVVIVYADSLLKEIAKFTAAQYFEKKEQIRRDAGENAEIYTYELVPGQTLSPQTIKPNHVTGQGIIVFARYATPGDHRQAIGPDREVTLQMGVKDFKVIPITNPSD
jgi:type VI secretion system protein